MAMPNIPIFSKLFKHKASAVSRRSPYRDWFLIVCSFAGTLLVILAASTIFYLLVSQNMIFKVTTESQLKEIVINRAPLVEVVEYYTNQEKKLGEIEIGGEVVVDPSR
jgi:hypothetical protein